jgi:hypothetical protein
MISVKDIRAIADRAVEEIHANKHDAVWKNESINWGDFGVVEVREKVVVRLEEGNSNEACLFVWNRLRDEGYTEDEVEVICEW